jgi:hypothetical protein
MAELHRANDELARQTMEVILLHQDADDNARVTAQLSAKNSIRFGALN